jgi:hypothetical protein
MGNSQASEGGRSPSANSNDWDFGLASLGKGDSANPQAMESFDERGAGLQVAAKLGASENPRGRLASGDRDTERAESSLGDDNARLPDEDEDGDQSDIGNQPVGRPMMACTIGARFAILAEDGIRRRVLQY